MIKTKISVILVTRNSKSVLFNCLKSLDNNDILSSYKNAEWIIVDNASSDGSIEEVNKIYPDVKIIKNNENLGFAKACNQGIKISTSEYLLFINTDTEIQQNAISKLYDCITGDTAIGVVGPRLIRKNGTIQKSAYPEATLFTEIFKPIVKLYVSIKENFYSLNKPNTVRSLRGACFMVSRETVNAAGLFDEQYFFYLEETDLFRRIRLNGKKICYFPDSKVYHYGGLGSDDKMTFDKKKMYNRSLLKYFAKNRNKFENLVIKKIIGD